MLLLTTLSIFGQQPKNFSTQLTEALKEGNHHALSAYFGSYVMVHIDDFQKVVSAQQAKTHLADFISKNKVSSVTLIKSGDKDKQQYCIWNYISETKKWRVYILLTSEDDQPLIHQIDIEKAQ